MELSEYEKFLHQKLYLIEHVTGCLFKGNCDEEKLKKNMEKIRKICYMSASDVAKALEEL